MKPTLSAIARPLVLLLPLLLIGCSTAMPGRNPAEPVRQYLLEWQPTAVSKTAPADAPVLQVTATSATAGFNSSDMIYISQPHQLQRFARHRWADSPARMLDPLLVRAAESSGLFSAVAAPGMPVSARLRLDTQVLHLQQRIGEDSSQVELAVRFSLIDIPSSRQLAAEAQTISVASAATPYAGVQAGNAAVARLMQQLTEFLQRHVPSR